VKSWLEAHQVEPRRIHFELFTVPGAYSGLMTQQPSSIQPSGLHTSRVTIRQDGIAFEFTLPYDAEPVLDAALKQGADLPYSCKGGVCASCRAKLLEGEVEMESNYALEPDERKAGFILTCQSHPRSPTLVIDFDLRS
jgi:ring-1,2-phenylacetyl-CoA epoxidase subunit PaaE